VRSTRVGYAGGCTAHPTYRSIGDHSESVEITYDPSRLSYAQLLELFWASHEPSVPAGSRQYASIIFYHDEQQRREAEQSKSEQERQRGRRLATEIRPAGTFTQAEDYHQKFYLQGALRRLLPAPADLVGSTLAARLNAFAAGELSLEELERDLPALQLEPKVQQELLETLRRGR